METTEETKRDELPVLSADLEQVVIKNRALSPSTTPIGLFCYGDHNRDIFYQFVCNMIPEEEKLPLSQLLMKEAFGSAIPSFDTILATLRAVRAIDPINDEGSESEEDEDKRFEEKLLKKHIEKLNDTFAGVYEFLNEYTQKKFHDLIPEHSEWKKDINYFRKSGSFAIRFMFKGRQYIVADTFSRHDYRTLDNEIYKIKDTTWRVHHVCLITHFLKCHGSVDKNLYKYDHDAFYKIFWEPGCARDVMCVMYQIRDDQHSSLWKSLTSEYFKGTGLLCDNFENKSIWNEPNLELQKNKITNYFTKTEDGGTQESNTMQH